MMTTYRVKIWFCLMCLASSMAAPAMEPVLALDIIDLAAISRMSPQQLEVLAEGLAAQEIMRTKRSSAQALSAVVSKASSGLTSKVGLLGQASAGVSSLISAASSKTGDEHGYSYEPHHEPKVDFWGLKKSILYTLFQAVKAITGGVTILKGQLIKGGGHLATTLGKVIAVKGDAVSNIGKKIVTSAALSPPKKHHASVHAPVYGPPPSAHVEYPPSAYGVPSAPAHYAGPSAPTGFAAHKYPAHLDGRGKLNGLHAGLILLTPVAGGADAHGEMEHAASEPGHTPLEPPSSFLHTAFSAIKNVFSSVAPASAHEDEQIEHIPEHQDVIDHPPPPPQLPEFKPMSWGAVNSYGVPAADDAFSDYDPRHPHPSFNVRASSKKSTVPKHRTQLTPEKIQKIKHNLNKIVHMQKNMQRSSEELPKFDGLDLYHQMLLKGRNIPLLPTPVVTDTEVGVLSAELQPSLESVTTSTTTTTPQPVTTTTETTRRKKDVKFILRGNRIVQV